MERTIRFKWLKNKKCWQVLVFKEGIGLQKPPYKIHIIGDVYGRYKAYCNCMYKQYNKNDCAHEKEFYNYMNKLISEGKTNVKI